MADRSESNSWVLRVLLSKVGLRANPLRYNETYQLYIDGGLVDLEKYASLEVRSSVFEAVVTVASAQELINQDQSTSLRVNVFDKLHSLARKTGLSLISTITYDMFDQVAFEYTWALNKLASEPKVTFSATCVDCGELPPFDRSKLFWKPDQQ